MVYRKLDLMEENSVTCGGTHASGDGGEEWSDEQNR